MRTDVEIDHRQVVCRKASLIGYSTCRAKWGSYFVYNEGGVPGARSLARMIGRIKYASQLAQREEPIRNWILAMVLSSSGLSAYERWVKPDWVLECYGAPPTKLAAFFFQPRIPYDGPTMRRLMDHGTVQDQFIEQHADRVAMFKERDALAKAR